MVSVDDNPFLSKIFTKTWLRHFKNEDDYIEFENLKGIKFVSGSIPKLYYNVGGTFTKGINYRISNPENIQFRNKVILIYDVPGYFDSDPGNEQKNLGIYKTKQYPGFGIKLDGFTDFPDYMSKIYSKSSRYKLNKYKRRLEQCFNINCRMYLGEITKSEYDDIFRSFKKLLLKRFGQKKTTNNNLKDSEWEFYFEVVYPMILDKKASLFVIYDNKKPISITLNYLSDNILFDAITVFDIDYSKFHLGSVAFMKLIDWSISNKLLIFDFSKGYFDYKVNWANFNYDFEYHLLYDRSSIYCRIVAWNLKQYFDLKQFLREKGVNERMHKLHFKILNIGKTEKKLAADYVFKDLMPDLNLKDTDSFNLKEDNRLMAPLCEFLYLNNENFEDISIYEFKNGGYDYIFVGQEKKIGIKFKN